MYVKIYKIIHHEITWNYHMQVPSVHECKSEIMQSPLIYYDTLSYLGGVTSVWTLNVGSKGLFDQGECKNNFVHLDLWAGPVFKVYYGFPTASTYAPKNPTFHVPRMHFMFPCATGRCFSLTIPLRSNMISKYPRLLTSLNGEQNRTPKSTHNGVLKSCSCKPWNYWKIPCLLLFCVEPMPRFICILRFCPPTRSARFRSSQCFSFSMFFCFLCRFFQGRVGPTFSR